MFNNKGITDYFQAKCLVIGVTQGQLGNTFSFDMDLLLASAPDDKWIVEPKVLLSTLCIKAGFVTSKNEFRRKCQQKGLKYNDEPIDKDVEIDATIPSIDHQVRLGKRFLEIVVPFDKDTYVDEPDEKTETK